MENVRKAAQVVQAGSTIILEDGEYYESDATIFANSGTKDAPITVRALTSTKQSLYTRTVQGFMPKMVIEKEQSYFIIQDLYFTQVNMVREEDATKNRHIPAAAAGPIANLSATALKVRMRI